MNEKLDHLKFVVSRYDNFIESSQSKSNLYIALNTAIIGGIITLFLSERELTFFSIILFGLTSLLSVVSLILTLMAINPYLKSNGSENKSTIFFMDVASMSYKKFRKRISSVNDDILLKDLACQAHNLAIGLKKKYFMLRIAGILIMGEFALLFISVIFLITKY